MQNEPIKREMQIEIMKFFMNTSIPRILKLKSTVKVAKENYD